LASEGELLEGPLIPECDENGLYVTIQCYWDDCWCVTNPYGYEVEGTRVASSEKNILSCNGETGKEPPPLLEPNYIPPEQEIGKRKQP